jgi:hypothetical protein
MCYILCMTSISVCYIASGVTQGGLRGGSPPENFFLPREMCHIFASFFRVALIFVSIVCSFEGSYD